jgi:hypothetical protein
MLRRILFATLVAICSLACAPAVQENVVLKPEAMEVEFATETPSSNAYSLVSTITSDAAGNEIDDAILSAKNDLRNKAAALGATLVIVDETRPDKDFVREKRIVHLKGRAFKVKE